MMIPIQGVLVVALLVLAIVIPVSWYQGYEAAKFDAREGREWQQ